MEIYLKPQISKMSTTHHSLFQESKRGSKYEGDTEVDESDDNITLIKIKPIDPDVHLPDVKSSERSQKPNSKDENKPDTSPVMFRKKKREIPEAIDPLKRLSRAPRVESIVEESQNLVLFDK